MQHEIKGLEDQKKLQARLNDYVINEVTVNTVHDFSNNAFLIYAMRKMHDEILNRFDGAGIKDLREIHTQLAGLKHVKETLGALQLKIISDIQEGNANEQ